MPLRFLILDRGVTSGDLSMTLTVLNLGVSGVSTETVRVGMM